jgi:hypothetical protein
MKRAIEKCKITLKELDKCKDQKTYRPLGTAYPLFLQFCYWFGRFLLMPKETMIKELKDLIDNKNKTISEYTVRFWNIDF